MSKKDFAPVTNDTLLGLIEAYEDSLKIRLDIEMADLREHAIPKMTARRWFGLRGPYWTSVAAPTDDNILEWLRHAGYWSSPRGTYRRKMDLPKTLRGLVAASTGVVFCTDDTIDELSFDHAASADPYWRRNF